MYHFIQKGSCFYAWKKVQMDTDKHNLAVVVYEYAKQNHELIKNNFFQQLDFFIIDLLATLGVSY